MFGRWKEDMNPSTPEEEVLRQEGGAADYISHHSPPPSPIPQHHHEQQPQQRREKQRHDLAEEEEEERFLLSASASQKEKDMDGKKGEEEEVEEEKDECNEALELDCSCQNAEWCQSMTASIVLKRFIDDTPVPLYSYHRHGYPLLVLDLDGTLIDGTLLNPPMVHRPYLMDFLKSVYKHYDLAIWSKTTEMWLHRKMQALGLMKHPHFQFCLLLARNAMLRAEAQYRVQEAENKQKIEREEDLDEEENVVIHYHLVKPLQLLWAHYPQWNKRNTLMIDDTPRSYGLNQSNGLLIKSFRRDHPHASQDKELLYLSTYLLDLAETPSPFSSLPSISCRSEEGDEGGKGEVDFSQIDHQRRREVVKGKMGME